MADARDDAPGMARGGLRRIALAALLAAVLSGAIATVGALAADPGDRWGATVVFLWTALPPVLGARACVLAQQRGWSPPWRRGAGAGAFALAAATLVHAELAAAGGPHLAVASWALLSTAAAAGLALAVGAIATARRGGFG